MGTLWLPNGGPKGPHMVAEGHQPSAGARFLAPIGGQTSRSWRGLVAFCHQIGALRAPWPVKMKFGALCAPPSSSFEGLMALVHLACLFMGLVVFFCFIHHGTPTGSFPECFVKIQLDLAEIFRI